MGVIDLRKYGDHYLKLRRIFERVVGIIEAIYLMNMQLRHLF